MEFNIAHLIRQAEDLMDREEWDEVAEVCYQVLTVRLSPSATPSA